MDGIEMELESFRLPVDLTYFFDDDRSWCYIYIEPQKFSIISDILSYLQRLFDIPPPVKLFIGKYLLPSCESIKILCTDDVLRVVGGSEKNQLAENNTTRVKKRKHSHAKKSESNFQENVSDIGSVVASSEVDAIEDHVLSNDTANICDQVVDKDSGAASQVLEEQPAVSAVEGITQLPEVKQFKQKTKRSSNVSEGMETAEEEKEHNQDFVEISERSDLVLDESDVSVTNGNQRKIPTQPAPSDCDVDFNIELDVLSKKRKRTRHRKRKMMLSSCVGEAVSLIRSSIGIMPFINSDQCHSSVSGYCTDSSSKHIRFSDDDGNTSFTAESDHDTPGVKVKSSKVSHNRNLPSPRLKSSSGWDVRSSPHSIPQTQNFVNLLSLRNKAAPVVFERKRTKQEAVEPSSLVVGMQVSESCSVPEQKSNNHVCEPSKEGVQQEHSLDPSSYPALSSPPRKHDIILFKTLVLTENCIPQLSSYIMATVVDFCPLSQDLKLQITSNGQELHQQPVKFATDAQTDLIEDDFTTLNWNEIHETHLVSRET